MKPPRARFNDGQQHTPRILNVEVQQSLTKMRGRQRIGSADTAAATDPQTHRQPPRQLRRSLILVRWPTMLAQRSKMKSCRDDRIIAQGKRGTSAALGKHAPKNIPSPHPMGRGIKGEGLLNLTEGRWPS